MDGRTPYLEWRFAGSSEQELSRICKSYDRSRTQSWNWYPSDARRNAQFLILFVNLVARGTRGSTRRSMHLRSHSSAAL
jgi:hypothetical protein